MAEGESDEELMPLIAAGNHRAFRILMSRHMRRAIRLAQGIVRNEADADDIAQEAFLRVWRRAASFDAELARFTTWMHQIVVNLAIDRARRPRTEPIEQAADVADDGPSQLALVVESEERTALLEALAAMPERQRAAITLFHFEELSGRESAQALDLSESAFESLLWRARATLKQTVQAALEHRGRK